MRLLLIRHAETALAGTFCGWSDPGLNEQGRAQLGALLERIAEERVAAVYSSDLARALETAEAIAATRGLAVEARRGLREIHFGEWEGMTWQEIEARSPDYAARWVAEFPALPAPGGEDYVEFRGRVLAAVAAIGGVEQSGATAVVSHGGALRVVLEELAGCSGDEAFRLTRDYTGIIRCELQPGGGRLRLEDR